MIEILTLTDGEMGRGQTVDDDLVLAELAALVHSPGTESVTIRRSDLHTTTTYRAVTW